MTLARRRVVEPQKTTRAIVKAQLTSAGSFIKVRTVFQALGD